MKKKLSTFENYRGIKRRGVNVLLECGFTIREALLRISADMPYLFERKSELDRKDKQLEKELQYA